MQRGIARTVHLGAALLFVLCVGIQVFLAGLGVFDDPEAFVTHREFGYLFGWLILVMLVAAIVGRLGRIQAGGAILLMVQFAFQSVFIAVRADQPAIAALHPLNGFLIGLVAVALASAAWREWRAAGRVAEPVAASAERPPASAIRTGGASGGGAS